LRSTSLLHGFPHSASHSSKKCLMLAGISLVSHCVLFTAQTPFACAFHLWYNRPMRTCEYCGNPTRERSDRPVRFCSISCSNKSRTLVLAEKTCPTCTLPFTPLAKHPGQIFCSTGCRDGRGKNILARHCAECGKQVMRPRYRSDLAHAFCDHTCRSAWLLKNAPRGADSSQWKPKPLLECETCGTAFLRKPSALYAHSFCSAACRIEWQKTSGYQSGANSHAWEGGRLAYYGENWLQQRRRARHRDGYRCRLCDTTEAELGCQLTVHHLIPFRAFNGDYKRANALPNLQSLCRRCHPIAEYRAKAALAALKGAPPPLFLRRSSRASVATS